MKLKKILLYLGALIVFAIIVLVIYMFPFYHFFFTSESTVIDKNLTMVSGAGNSGILVTDSAVVVIDTKMFSLAKDLYKMAKEKAGSKKIIVINTHLHGDHTNGNHLYNGSKIYIGGYDPAFVKKEMKPENRPTDFVTDSLILNLGDETVAMYNMGQAHTFDDMVVYLRNRKLLFSGDLVFNKINPALIRPNGTDIDKWKAMLNLLPTRLDIKTVIPGHGKAGGPEMIAALSQYFSDMQAAASTRGKVRETKARYNDWMKMPLMSSPQKTIDFIRSK